jgi:transposase
MKKKSSRRRIDVNVDELDRIIDAAMQGPLNETDGRTLKTAVHAMAERLVRRRNTEKTSAVLEPKAPAAAADTQPEPEKPTPAGHGRNGADAFTGANRVAVAHATLHSGDLCPGCRDGRVYRQKEPATLIRVIGQAPLTATVFQMERLRCNACGEMFTAVAMIALLKYGTGMPFNRMERLEGQLGMPLPAATQWELMEAAAKLIRCVLDVLIRQAAQGSVVHNDDTSMRVLKLARNTVDGRTGVFTSGIVSISGGWKIALYFTGWKHAGENHADVLKQRAAELEAPIQMCDALSRNSPKLIETLLANCLAHGRRQFTEVAESFPDECRYVLESLGAVYGFDAEAKESRPGAGGKVDVSSDAQRAGDGKSAPVAGGSVCGT